MVKKLKKTKENEVKILGEAEVGGRIVRLKRDSNYYRIIISKGRCQKPSEEWIERDVTLTPEEIEAVVKLYKDEETVKLSGENTQLKDEIRKLREELKLLRTASQRAYHEALARMH